ncbi:50S ribosomal protein L28 [Candidatus Peregrinibacteria bacterium]|nr:MAG: 50S ribosomal protein L28 [Candidatus Peregrinibacteria bacterium]
MAKVCDITGKKPSTGNNVSHSVRRTKRRFLPNLQWKRIFDPTVQRWIRIRVCTSALRTLAKPLTNREKKRMEKKLSVEQK